MTDTEWLSFLDKCEAAAWKITNHNLAHKGDRIWSQKARIVVKVSVGQTNSKMSGYAGHWYWWTVFDRKTNKTLIKGKNKNQLKAKEIAEEEKERFIEKLCPKGNCL